MVQAHLSNLEETSSSSFWESADSNGHAIYPRFRAVIVVLGTVYDVGAVARNSDGAFLLDDFLEKQNVVLARTGDNGHLSALISFAGLGFGSPSAFQDHDILRVSFGTAVRFIARLIKRETSARRNQDSENWTLATEDELPLEDDFGLRDPFAEPEYYGWWYPFRQTALEYIKDGWQNRIPSGCYLDVPLQRVEARQRGFGIVETDGWGDCELSHRGTLR